MLLAQLHGDESAECLLRRPLCIYISGREMGKVLRYWKVVCHIFLHVFNSNHVIGDHLFTSHTLFIYIYFFDKAYLTNLPETFIT